uniref:Putative retrotransposon protein n=1 Tax=Phyllostachys edulis TaxID=38705 RepID=D3IVG0_PHYED|nr:putative retrotransposon protein [Phyllostachys edulis]
MSKLERPHRHHSGSHSSTAPTAFNRSNNSPYGDRHKLHRSPNRKRVSRTPDDQKAPKRDDKHPQEAGESSKKKDKKAKKSKNKAKGQKPEANGSKEVLTVSDKEPRSSKQYSDQGKGKRPKQKNDKPMWYPFQKKRKDMTSATAEFFNENSRTTTTAKDHFLPSKRTEKISFDVVDFDTAYNAIIGQPALAKFLMATHYGYQCLKMPGPKGVITIHYDKKMAYTCDRRSLEMVG